MLGTLLDKLVSLLSKNLIIGSIPLFAFLFFNGLMLYRVSYHFQQWTARYFFSQDLVRQALLSFAFLIVIVILTYVLFSLNSLLREILEGKHLPFAFLANAFSQRFRERLSELEKQMQLARKKLRDLRTKDREWQISLRAAYQAGTAVQQCTYQRSNDLTHLLDRSRRNAEVTLEDLTPVVDAMQLSLQTNNPELLNNAASGNLDIDSGEVQRLVRYAVDKAQGNYARLMAEYQFDYAGEEVAATRMGNISRIAPHYATSRYSLNLDIFWTRLQKVVQADTNFYSAFQDAKLQLDFLIALLWYTLIFTLTWVIALPLLREAKNWFLLIAFAGPLVTYVWYRIALQTYRAFSDLLRASVDLYRLDLLNTLRIPLPASAEEERLIWERLERRIVYNEHSNMVLRQT
jgi:hypothetical protein